MLSNARAGRWFGPDSWNREGFLILVIFADFLSRKSKTRDVDCQWRLRQLMPRLACIIPTEMLPERDNRLDSGRTEQNDPIESREMRLYACVQRIITLLKMNQEYLR